MKLSLSQICVFLLSLWLLNSCSFFYKDPVVLQINSKKWTSRQFAKLLAEKIHALNIQNARDNLLIENLKEQLTTDLIMEYLIHQWAKTHSIFITESELQQTLKQIKNSYPSDAIFKLYLKTKKTNKEEWKKQIKNNLLNKKIIEKIGSKAKAPSIEEMQEYYQNNLHSFKKNSQILIHHIFHKRKEIITKIQKALIQENNLIAAARQFTKHTQIIKSQWVEKGTFKVFDQAFSLKKQEISPIWSSPYAYHIIQVLDKKPAQQIAFETVKKQISQKLLAQRKKALFSKWLDKQSKKINILKNEGVIKKMKVQLL